MVIMMLIKSILMIMLYDRENEVEDENHCWEARGEHCSTEKSKTTENDSFLIR